MLLTAPVERGALIAELALYYGTDQRLWRSMETATLQRAWRVTQLHAEWDAAERRRTPITTPTNATNIAGG